MQRNTLLASALALLIAGSASFAMAQNTPPTAPQAAPTRDAGTLPGDRDHKAFARILRGDRDHGMAGHRMHHQRGGVIGDLHALERLYTQAGRGKDMAAIYNDVLAKSQDPRVRDYAYQRLARLQAQPTNVDQAIATLRKSLNENLANEAKQRAEREKMRAAWQQRAGKVAPDAK
ncbi:MAG TPA: hypothetical protein VN624_09455 [Rhodanobacter sp.]|nr:hypothetical protein [Rhodanobacter sp.]